MNSIFAPVPKLALTILEAEEASSLGRTALLEDIKAGKLKARKRGRRTVILTSELAKYLESLPEEKVQ